MTLQQKLLAKQSKKGFTLVELVVVIAILAILAAIAIPAVVGIIDNAQKSAKNSNAAALDGAAKKLYAGVTAGSINASTPANERGGLGTANLPAATDSTSTKKSKAAALSVYDAVLYAGLKSAFDSENCNDYGYSTADGTIVYFNGLSSDAQSGYTQFAADEAPSATSTTAGSFAKTTLGTIYKVGQTTTQTPAGGNG